MELYISEENGGNPHPPKTKTKQPTDNKQQQQTKRKVEWTKMQKSRAPVAGKTPVRAIF